MVHFAIYFVSVHKTQKKRARKLKIYIHSKKTNKFVEKRRKSRENEEQRGTIGNRRIDFIDQSFVRTDSLAFLRTSQETNFRLGGLSINN